MAGNPVRELITRIKFQLDTQSVSKANKAVADLKKKLDSLSKSNHIRIAVDAQSQKITQLSKARRSKSRLMRQRRR